MGNFMGKEYSIKVEDVKFDTTISQFNRVQDEQEYKKTLLSIKELGQIEPIYMDSGYCIDGRHRTKAMRELGIDWAHSDRWTPLGR